MVENNGSLPLAMNEQGEDVRDFTVDDLVLLKDILLNLEKAIDEIVIRNTLMGSGETFEGGYIFQLLEKANVIILSNSFSIYVPIHSCFLMFCRLWRQMPRLC